MSCLRAQFIAWLIACCTFLSGCADLTPYHTENASNSVYGSSATAATSASGPCYDPPEGVPDEVCVRFVEYDDFGNLFNRRQLDDTVAAAGRVAAGGGIVVVYTHGWKHNAASGDEDLIEFHKAMQNTRKVYRQISPEGKRQILGIYVGWRGESLDIPLLNNLTFWERKSTAQAVGDGAVFELFRKLANHRVLNPNSRLVLIGHSFGAAITYSSVAHSIMAQIVDDPEPAPGYRPGTSDTRSTLDDPKRWDMVVLINPAFEAMQLRPHLSLARSRTYLENQLPHLILVTSQADWATRVAFPAGRYLRSTLNKYNDAASADMYRTAVGHYIPFITHQLAVVPDCPPAHIANQPVAAAGAQLPSLSTPGTKFTCFNDPRTIFVELKKKADGSVQVPAVLMTRCEAADDCAKVAGRHHMDMPAHMPIMNIRTTKELMRDHSDIWNPTMHSFLVQLMLSIVQRGTPAATPNPTPAVAATAQADRLNQNPSSAPR